MYAPLAQLGTAACWQHGVPRQPTCTCVTSVVVRADEELNNICSAADVNKDDQISLKEFIDLANELIKLHNDRSAVLVQKHARGHATRSVSAAQPKRSER